MSSMAIDRRHFLIGTALTFAAASASRAFAGMLDDEHGIGRRRRRSHRRLPPPRRHILGRRADARRHGAARAAARRPRPRHRARPCQRPGRRVRAPARIVRARFRYPRTAREPVLFTTPANRHFYGHGVFSRDGRLLYATEHDNETRDGLIGVYNADRRLQAHRRDPDLRHRPARGDPAQPTARRSPSPTAASKRTSRRGARSSISIPCSPRSPSSTAPTAG